MNIRTVIAAGALLVATGAVAHADTSRTVLLAYSNDIDGPIAQTAVTYARDAHPDVNFLLLAAPDPADITVPLPHDVDCVVGVGRDAHLYIGEWEASHHPVDSTVVQGDDRYQTAANIKTAIRRCL